MSHDHTTASSLGNRARPCLKKEKKKEAKVQNKNLGGLGAVARTYNPNTLGGQGRRIAWVQEFKTNLGNIVRPCLYKK